MLDIIRSLQRTPLILLLWSAVSCCALAEDTATFFESRIRPLLVQRCYDCHGEKKQEGGLRLDSRLGWQAGGGNGSVIAPGDMEQSRLIAAVRYSDPELQMPPLKRLSDREIADLEAWVQLGAYDPRDQVTPNARSEEKLLWSLQPITQVAPTLDEKTDPGLSPIDTFIRQRLIDVGLQSSPMADRRTLIRRATFDLTGLPPTPSDVDVFVQDESSDAYEWLIERLLDSPSYGEHWARHWLDVARYSDTKGYVYAREENRWIHASAYRDWVVRALNEDMPYDRFVKLQLAADQLVPAGSADLAAMGFLTLGRRFLGVTHDIIDDRIDVVTRGLLGLTVACARCHDHKYDAIPTRDYYSLYGVFQSSAEQVVACSEWPDDVIPEELATRKSQLDETMAMRREEQSARTRAKLDEYLLAQLELEKYPEEVFNQILDEHDINPAVVRKWQVFLEKDRQSSDPLFAQWHELTDRLATRELQELAKFFATQYNEIDRRWQAFQTLHPDENAFPDADDERRRKVIYGTESPCHVPDEHIVNIEMYFPTNVITELWKFQNEFDRWILNNAEAPVHATILVDRAAVVTPRVFKRGNPLDKGPEVPRQFLNLLSKGDPNPFLQGSGRLELANAIAASDNPLTARVIVNRVWMHHFGQGLVNTPSDFGHRAEEPSHPELLDWLARQLIDSNWSLKHLHRVIMLSETYQQTSHGPTNPELFAQSQRLDPGNRLLWRMTAHRLTFEEARDAWLASSGELDRRVGGKADTLFAMNNFRRTLYSFVDREKLSPILRMFDFANPDLSIPQRSETTVPQQALFGLNHPFIADRSIQLTQALSGKNLQSRVTQLYRRLYQRMPTIVERESALAFVQASSIHVPPQKKSFGHWSYGYGEFDIDSGRIKNFTRLPYFNGTAWQGGENFPDGKLGWLQLTATGGHPGNDLKNAVVRRWTATQDGDYKLNSALNHEPEVGDGIRAFISHNAQGLLRSTMIHHSREQIDIDSISMKKGESLDFVVDILKGLNSDQFHWSPTLRLLGAAGSGGDTADQVSDAETDFGDENAIRLDPWQQLAQVLMLTNEFMFVD